MHILRFHRRRTVSESLGVRGAHQRTVFQQTLQLTPRDPQVCESLILEADAAPKEPSLPFQPSLHPSAPHRTQFERGGIAVAGEI